jgi:hypothetical protein
MVGRYSLRFSLKLFECIFFFVEVVECIVNGRLKLVMVSNFYILLK